MLAITPDDPARFNGTVVVEWLNTSTGQDLPAQWFQLHRSIMDEGNAYLGVSAQPDSTASLTAWDSARYGTLQHPGTAWSFDVFSQAIQSVRAPLGTNPLGELVPTSVIATGVSQSAVRLDEYIDFGPEAEADVIDGYLIERNVDTKVAYLGEHPPVINIATEESTEPVSVTSGDSWRLWQVAGGAHVDRWFNRFWRAQLNKNNTSHAAPAAGAETAIDDDAGQYGQRPQPEGLLCGPGSLYPSRYVSRLGLAQMHAWIVDGVPAITVPPLDFLVPVGPAGSTLARDDFGNATGGFRSPVVDVPLVTYLGNTCGLSGHTLEAPPGAVAARYSTQADYLAQLEASVETAVAERRLLHADGDDLLQRAASGIVPR